MTSQTPEHTVTAHLHDRTCRHHLFMASAICLVEICLILGVEAMIVHILVTVGLFGRDVVTEILGAE